MEAEKTFVSLVIPAYRSEQTIGASLQTMLAQDYGNYEVIVIDSSPDDATERIVSRFDSVIYTHSPVRLLPYAARNEGFRRARGDLIVTSDPDIYAGPGWLTSMVESVETYGGVVAGALRCHGNRWVESGMHFCKFDSWLGGGQPRRVALVASANMALSKDLFDEVGPFDERSMLSDTLFSWQLRHGGIPITFVPDATVAHHHIGSWASLLKERYQRGQEFARHRLDEEHWPTPRILLHFLVTALPIRVLSLLARTTRNSLGAGLLWQLVRVLPVVISGQTAWLLGEAKIYWRLLSGRAGQ